VTACVTPCHHPDFYAPLFSLSLASSPNLLLCSISNSSHSPAPETALLSATRDTSRFCLFTPHIMPLNTLVLAIHVGLGPNYQFCFFGEVRGHHNWRELLKIVLLATLSQYFLCSDSSGERACLWLWICAVDPGIWLRHLA